MQKVESRVDRTTPVQSSAEHGVEDRARSGAETMHIPTEQTSPDLSCAGQGAELSGAQSTAQHTAAQSQLTVGLLSRSQRTTKRNGKQSAAECREEHRAVC